MSQVSALRKTLRAMKSAGELAEVDDALIGLVEGLAAAVDADGSNAALWREYRAALATLKEAAAGGTDDDTQSFLIAIQTPGRRAEVGDTQKS